MNTKIIIKNMKTVAPFLFLLLAWQNNAFAITNAYVSTEKGTSLLIDLSRNIDIPDANVVTITISTAATKGIAVWTPGTQVIDYTPNQNVNGETDVFFYTIFDANNVSQGSASVTISIGSATLAPADNQAQTEIDNILNDTCSAPADTDFDAICQQYYNLTAGERAALADQLAPREIDSQIQLSTSIASQQIDTIRQRLAAVRLGMQGINPIQLSYQYKDQRPLSLADLFTTDARGGGASALGAPVRRYGIYFSGNFGGGSYSPQTGTSVDGYSYKSNGITAGMDYRLNGQTVFGGAIGYIGSTMDIDQSGGDVEGKGFNMIGYGSYYVSNKVYIEFIAAAYLNNFDMTRNMSYTGVKVSPSGEVMLDGNGNAILEQKSATASSETDNGVVSFSFGSGYEMLSQRGLTMNLIGNLDYIKSGIDGYQETGAPGYNLTINKREESKFTSTLNVSTTYAISQRNGILIPQFDLAWKHEFIDDANTISGAFVSDPVNTSFSFNTLSPDTDYFKASLGIQYLIPGGTTGFALYEQTLARSNYKDYNISIGMRGEF